MSYTKCINIPHYAKYVFAIGDRDLGIRYSEKGEIRKYPYLKRINPFFGVTGWYYDRFLKNSWVEVNGIAFVEDSRMWKIQFEEFNIPWIGADDRKALEQLRRSGLISKEQRLILRWNARRQNDRLENFRSRTSAIEFKKRLELFKTAKTTTKAKEDLNETESLS